MSDFFASMPQEAALAFVLGGVLFASGALLIVLVIRHYLAERSGPVESFLAPVLAVDTLDPRLRVIWVKSMLLDAEASPPDLPAARKLSREVRRCLIEAQAHSVAQRAGSFESLRLLTADSLDSALTAIRSSGAPDFEGLRRALQEKRTALGEDAEGR